ncbi:fatty acid conjugase FAC2 B-like [Cynara cardunculus var. scolymus]|uniref:fatty acid conjugase FAC2 B-like n=1 Tax=Cynara cardunculus var. scolymus TaxID=59895 RepID=UPI000D62F719|nr:fatty acid conjugase FAC2 B-like [Cynara cardunculus var. scolymus]
MKVLERVPISKPPFEYSDLKNAIPSHCFKQSLFRSFFSVFRDGLTISILFYVASNYIPVLPRFISFIAWPLYWICQGVMFGSLWTLGHECGHRGFSGYYWLDDTVGFLLHSFILTPYFSFKYSHRRHHAHTNSLEYDEMHVPKHKSNNSLLAKILDNPIGVAVRILCRVTLGYPLYLIFNHSGRKYEGMASHLYPQSPIFNDSERGLIYLSDLGIFVVLYAYYRMVLTKGAIWAFCIYGAPWCIMGGILIVLTYLQHSHPSIAHFDSTEWNWIRGALSTIDRDLGFMNMIVHDVPRNHVVHHLFPSIPHYHALEATEAIKPILGDYYKYDGTPIMKALWREMKECIYVESDNDLKNTGVYWFKSITKEP